MKTFQYSAALIALAFFAPSFAEAATMPNLGTGANFLAVAASSVTSAGASMIYGDVATSTGTQISILPPGKIIGAIHANDAAAMSAVADLGATYEDLNARSCDMTLPTNAGGQTYSPGVYCSVSNVNAIDQINLDAFGNSNAVFIFKVKNYLIFGDNAKIHLANGAQASNVFWLVGSYAIIGADSDFQGSVLAANTVEVKNGATVRGRLFSRNDGISFDSNVISSLLADVSVVTSVDVAQPAEGELVVLTVRVTNNGPDTTDHVAIKETLPANVTYVSASPTRGEYANGIWTVGRLDSLNNGILNISVRANAGTFGNTLTHTAELTASATVDPDSTPGNGSVAEDDYSSASFTVSRAGSTTVIPTTDPTLLGTFDAAVATSVTPNIDMDKALVAVPGQPSPCIDGTRIKGSGPAVYYCGANGKRYVFPSQSVYMTWYSDFSGVITMSDVALGQIFLGGNVTSKPGVRMVKIQSDPRVYAIARGGTLRLVGSETIAASIYGALWNKKIDDVSDAFFINYKMGEPITSL